MKLCGEQYGAFFDEADFIEYLNTVLYPDKPSKKLKTFKAADDEDVPEEYRKYPYYNFNEKHYAEHAIENGYVLDITDSCYHHEIDLSDASKVEPGKMKTVIRHPIKKI